MHFASVYFFVGIRPTAFVIPQIANGTTTAFTSSRRQQRRPTETDPNQNEVTRDCSHPSGCDRCGDDPSPSGWQGWLVGSTEHRSARSKRSSLEPTEGR